MATRHLEDQSWPYLKVDKVEVPKFVKDPYVSDNEKKLNLTTYEEAFLEDDLYVDYYAIGYEAALSGQSQITPHEIYGAGFDAQALWSNGYKQGLEDLDNTTNDEEDILDMQTRDMEDK